MSPAERSDLQAVEYLHSSHERIRKEIAKVIIGQDKVVEQLLISLLSSGHCLLVGVPGLAKTLLISTLARVLNLKFSRIQFTPDLMPSDITGTEIIEEDQSTRRRDFRFVKGPVFANIILADEINRTPPKTQAALLQAMQEHEVTASGQTYKLDEPFFVLATQNPIEQEGTYPLPEAQLDRFMFNVFVDYPSEAEEASIVKSTTAGSVAQLDKILTADEIIAFQQLVRRVPVSDHLVEYAVQLVRATRPKETGAPEFVKNWVNWGAGPRASQYLILAAKTRAILEGRPTPGPEDVRFAAYPVLRHRIVTSFNAEADGVDTMEIIMRILETVKEREGRAEQAMTTDPFAQFSLRNLPHHAKWFVGIITALMLCVCIWAMWIFYERKGRVTAETILPAYLHKADKEEAVKLPPDVQKDVAEVQADSESVLPPEWDSNAAGKEKKIDSATLAKIKTQAVNPEDDEWGDEKKFSHDLGLAHTHVNGQTLLFFVIGFFYLFTSATPRNKKMLFIIFGISIFLHAVGLTGQHVNELFNDLLAVSGVAILVIMAYMAFRIFVDLGHAPVSEKAKE